MWRGDGKELFFEGLDGSMMSAPLEATRQFAPQVPQTLFKLPELNTRRAYAVIRDGKRLLVVALGTDRDTPPPLTVVGNWLPATPK